MGLNWIFSSLGKQWNYNDDGRNYFELQNHNWDCVQVRLAKSFHTDKLKKKGRGNLVKFWFYKLVFIKQLFPRIFSITSIPKCPFYSNVVCSISLFMNLWLPAGIIKFIDAPVIEYAACLKIVFLTGFLNFVNFIILPCLTSLRLVKGKCHCIAECDVHIKQFFVSLRNKKLI